MKKNIIILIISFTCCTCLDLTGYPKCSIYNSTCQAMFIATVAKNISATGISEIGIPHIDHFPIKNVSLNILRLIKMTITEGQADGIVNCRGRSYETNVEERYKELAVICNITVRGRYKLTSAPALKESFADIHGDGNLTLTFEQWYFKVRYGIEIVKKADGKIYIEGLFDQDHTAYENAVGNLNVEINGLMRGNRDVSQTATYLINKYWKAIMASDIGEFINFKSVQYLFDVYKRLFNNAPADSYLTDDLSGLVDRKE